MSTTSLFSLLVKRALESQLHPFSSLENNANPIIINFKVVVMFLSSYSFDFYYCLLHKVVNNVLCWCMRRVLFLSFLLNDGMHNRKMTVVFRLHHKSFNLMELSFFETRRYNITSRERSFMCAQVNNEASSEESESMTK